MSRYPKWDPIKHKKALVDSRRAEVEAQSAEVAWLRKAHVPVARDDVLERAAGTS